MLDDLKVRIKIFSLQAFHMLLIMFVGVTCVIGMARIKGEFKASNENHTAALVQLSGVLDDVHQIQTLVARAAAESSESRLADVSAEIKRLEGDRNRLWLDYIATRISPDEEAMVWRGEHAWTAYSVALHPGPAAPVQVASLQAVPLATPVVRLDDAGRNLDTVRDTVRQLISLQGRDANSEYAAANGLFMKLGIFNLLLICVGLGLAGLLMFWDFVRMRRNGSLRAGRMESATQ